MANGNGLSNPIASLLAPLTQIESSFSLSLAPLLTPFNLTPPPGPATILSNITSQGAFPGLPTLPGFPGMGASGGNGTNGNNMAAAQAINRRSQRQRAMIAQQTSFASTRRGF